MQFCGRSWRGILTSLGLGAGLCCTLGAVGAEAEKPWRLDSALETPEWLDISGEQRTRYEYLGGQFRVGREGNDQALALRTSLLTQMKGEPGRVVVEMLDARQYLSDAGSPIDTTMVDAIDVLQAYLRWDAKDLIPGGTNTIRLGRETLDLGNRRLVARNAFRNTINSFTGLDWSWEANGGGSARGFFFLPVRRLPDDRESLLDNDVVLDTQGWDTRFAGVYGEIPGLPWGMRLEAYYLNLHDAMTARARGRDLHTTGLRAYRNPAAGKWDYEFETTQQFGESQERTGLAVPMADHFAHHHHGAVGYSFDVLLHPRLGVRYDYASGDERAGDGENGRFDTLYGARRFDFGPTGIYGAVARANLNSPEYNLALRPWRGVETIFSHRFLWLAEARDAWTTAGRVDPTGASGTELGQQFEARVRWQALPGNLRWEAGYTHLFAGEFIRVAPGAATRGDARYFFLEMTLQF